MSLTDKVTKLENQIDRLTEVVMQLVGGLFNDPKQSKMIDLHIAILRGEDTLPPVDNTEYSFPTTRQGDLLEKRFAAFEEDFRLLKEYFKA